MATACPPPPPPPSPCGSQALQADLTPHPQHAAVPFSRDPPIQETQQYSEAPQDAQGAEGQPIDPNQNLTEDLASYGQNICSGGAEKCPPVQETDPVPQALGAQQMTVQQDERDA